MAEPAAAPVPDTTSTPVVPEVTAGPEQLPAPTSAPAPTRTASGQAPSDQVAAERAAFQQAVSEQSAAHHDGQNDSLLRGILRGAWMTVLGLAVVVVSFVLPRLLGAVPLAVLTGSMEPVYKPGDLVNSQQTPPNEIRIGDVITFQPKSGDPTLITHRVIAKEVDGDGVASITTRGDANGAADKPVVPAQVKGKVIYSVPYIGYMSTLLDAGAKTVLIGAGGVALLGYALFAFIGAGRNRRKAKPGASM